MTTTLTARAPDAISLVGTLRIVGSSSTAAAGSEAAHPILQVTDSENFNPLKLKSNRVINQLHSRNRKQSASISI
jgi:translation initiation factor 2B subunit (eIF-2B alpha/beta/delta family)